MKTELHDPALEVVHSHLDAAYEREQELYRLLSRQVNRISVLILPVLVLLGLTIFYPGWPIGLRIIVGLSCAVTAYVLAAYGFQVATHKPYLEKCRHCQHYTHQNPNSPVYPCRYCGEEKPGGY